MSSSWHWDQTSEKISTCHGSNEEPERTQGPQFRAALGHVDDQGIGDDVKNGEQSGSDYEEELALPLAVGIQGEGVREDALLTAK